ncbi:hypothetical protein [Microcoleus vaginatus]|uniref:hypothetical protein n=1 Tax=Microcoleus vaginatus TaxID=119532 RepID=UPI001682FFAB|nr:hypothetical protein [Microcoleus sp. FACHB-84]MBD2009043.1 hypothetical protein [Microcoleus sp. FACHB-45]
MRLLRTIAALSAALTPLMAEAAFSRPMPGTADFPRASNPQVNVPVCFIETRGGTTFDLVSLCGSNAAPQNTAAGNAPANNPNAGTPPPPPNPNAITIDGAGTPITTPAGTANPNNPNNANPGTSPAGTPNNANPGTSPAGTPNANPGTSPAGTPNANPGSSPAGTPNANPGSSPTTNPNNLNPGSSPYITPNNPNPGTSPNTNQNNLNPGSSPSTSPNNSASPTGGTAGGSNGDLVPNPTINLPRVPPSSFGPGGVAPTREAIDGPRQ